MRYTRIKPKKEKQRNYIKWFLFKYTHVFFYTEVKGLLRITWKCTCFTFRVPLYVHHVPSIRAALKPLDDTEPPVQGSNDPSCFFEQCKQEHSCGGQDLIQGWAPQTGTYRHRRDLQGAPRLHQRRRWGMVGSCSCPTDLAELSPSPNWSNTSTTFTQLCQDLLMFHTLKSIKSITTW